MGDITVFWAIYLIITSWYKNKCVKYFHFSICTTEASTSKYLQTYKNLNATFFNDTVQCVMQAILVHPWKWAEKELLHKEP